MDLTFKDFFNLTQMQWTLFSKNKVIKFKKVLNKVPYIINFDDYMS